jgi:hypothetical protein
LPSASLPLNDSVCVISVAIFFATLVST